MSGESFFSESAYVIAAGDTVTIYKRLAWFRLFYTDESDLSFSVNNGDFFPFRTGFRFLAKRTDVERLRIRNNSASSANVILMSGSDDIESDLLVLDAAGAPLKTEQQGAVTIDSTTPVDVFAFDAVALVDRWCSGETAQLAGSGVNVLIKSSEVGYNLLLNHVDLYQIGGTEALIGIVGTNSGNVYFKTYLPADGAVSVDFSKSLFIDDIDDSLELYTGAPAGLTVNCVASGYRVGA